MDEQAFYRWADHVVALFKGVKRKGQPGFEPTYPYRKIKDAEPAPRVAGRRLPAGHPILAGLQGIHDHADTPEHVRGALRGLIETHGPAPAREPKAKNVNEELVKEHVAKLEAALGNESEFPMVLTELASHNGDHVRAVARAFNGGRASSRKEAMAHIARRHNVLVGARAREASRDGRIAG